jgi:SpoVK/Ycf46/Vps4 family AAA+-type ATPase
VLLHGPPGCAKTTLARAAAGSAGVAFLSLGPADVYATSYVGDAEAVVRRAFDLARSAAPCVLFFDEIDAIVATDDQGGHGMGRGPSAEARVLSTFLNEMDGVDGSVEDGVLVLGATNRPGSLDAALLRPGRFDRVVYVPPPDEAGRKAILSMECKKWHDALLAYYSHPNEDKNGTMTDAGDLSPAYFNTDILSSDDVSGCMTGAEIVGSCREAAVAVMRTIMIESHSEGDGALLSKSTAERHMQSLMRQLKITLAGKTPLLSNPDVFEEYTMFERNNNK